MVVAANPALAGETTLIQWEEVPCPLCASDSYHTVLDAADPDPAQAGLHFAVVCCEQCGLRFTNPRPSADAISRFYSASYPAFRKPGLLRNLSRRWYPFARIFGRPCIERRMLPWHGQGRLLDFGCGGGKFLLRMQDQGWKAMGIDRSVDTIRQLREQVGVSAIAGTLPHADLQPESFDIITMWSTLAHVHKPLDVLRAAHRLLTPGGRLYVEVPNIQSWAFRWFRGRWTGLDLPRHLTHFSAPTLRAMLESAGFRIQSIKGVAHPDWQRASARRDADSPFVLQLLRIKPIAHLVSWLAYLFGRADSIMSIAERPTN